MNDVLGFNESLNSPFQEDIRGEDTSAWIAIAACVATWIVLFAGGSGLLRYGFVATSLLCSLYLYSRNEIQYVSFTWWLYFLTPFIRRVVDYRIGFDPSSLMLVAPLLASAVSCIELLKVRRLDGRSLPFVLGTLGVTYGLAVSLIMRTSIITAAQYFLSWLGPIAFGYLLYARWPRYSQFRDALRDTFKWGLLVMGGYGVIQYLYAPAWDSFWMEHVSERISSFGKPEPLGIRVFSTMNAPQTFAVAVVIGLLVTFCGRSSLLQKVAWVAGYSGLLLSMARSAWLEWAIALGALAFLGRSRKTLSTVLVAVLFFVALGTMIAKSPMSQRVVERFQTLNNLQEDGSGQERLAGYKNVLKVALAFPFGEGWRIEIEGNPMPIRDSGAAEVLLCTGWFGLVMFYGVLICTIFAILPYARLSVDPFIPVASALLLALLAETIFNSMMGGSNQLGVMTIIGLGLGATEKYRSEASSARLSEIYNNTVDLPTASKANILDKRFIS
jgi:hypothetical protein